MKSANTNLRYDKISTFPEENTDGNVVYAVMETPQKTRHKYAFDAQIGIFMLKHTLASGLEWPYDYGFIPQTLGNDGDPLDILLLQDEPTFPGCLVKDGLWASYESTRTASRMTASSDVPYTCPERPFLLTNITMSMTCPKN